MTDCYLGLGSNLNHPREQIKQAIAAITQWPDTTVLKISSLYDTKPYGPIEQPDFVNAVILIDTTLSPHTLLAQAKMQETLQKRKKTVHWGPRTIDIDILIYGDVTLTSPELTLPHPGILERDFVLRPLQEIAPDVLIFP